MKLIDSSWQIIEQKPGLQGIYEVIETAGRTCYQSERKEGSTAEDFVNRMIASGHHAMLEFGTVYLDFTDEWIEALERYKNNPYSKVYKNTLQNNWETPHVYVSTNYRVLIENGWLKDLKYLCEPTEYHERRVTVKFTTSNGIARELTRHRKFSFAQESTRYCNYNKGKFNNEITFIKPYWYLDKNVESRHINSVILEQALAKAEFEYMNLINSGCKAQEAREVLPLSTKCDLMMSGFFVDWLYLFRLRTSTIAETGKPHPDMSKLINPLYEKFKK